MTFVPIFLILLSILILGILILGEFVLKEYLLVTPEMSGYAHLMDTIKILTAGEALIIADLIIPCAIALVGLFSLLNIIANLIKIKSRGACAVSKICLFFMIALSLALILINMINQETIEYGLYGIAGLSFISLLVGYLAKKSNNT